MIDCVAPGLGMMRVAFAGLALWCFSPSSLGVYGDVMRVKILFNKKENALIQMSDGTQAQLGSDAAALQNTIFCLWSTTFIFFFFFSSSHYYTVHCLEPLLRRVIQLLLW